MKQSYKITWVENRERKQTIIKESSVFKALFKWVENTPEKGFCSIVKIPSVNAKK